MASWKKFENQCYQYLVKRYGHICKFEPLGNSDSTKPDMRVIPMRQAPFFMETKENAAQCGQFVLLPNEANRTFEYSTGNKSTLNPYSQRIIEYMNRQFDRFSKAGTRGQEIELSKDVFYLWIKHYYAGKGVKFFITKGTKGYIIVPIEKFEAYFSVSAIYRMKRSGSADPSRSNMSEIRTILNGRGKSYELHMVSKKVYVRTISDLAGLKLRGTSYTYFFNQEERGLYRVRKLSNTQNANVIFSIGLQKEQDLLDIKEFENSIQ